MHENPYPTKRRHRRSRRRARFIPSILLIAFLLAGCIHAFAKQPTEENVFILTAEPSAPSEATAAATGPAETLPEADSIDAAADALLDTLLWDGATTQEQVYAIYRWARQSLSYGGHSDREDWRQAAYTMLTEYRGDCFGYFAVTKLLFERLGIPNIDVQKVRNYEDDSDHYWSLVSVDGGETWYHFDATPRVGEGDDFCLVTDAFLDAYSDEHKGSHNRDKSLYPATPEEPLT